MAACGHCGRTAAEAGAPKLMACSGCRVARYCSRGCQKAAWPKHKVECRAQRANAESAPKAPAPAMPVMQPGTMKQHTEYFRGLPDKEKGELTDSIIRKWRNKGVFICFVDGNPNNRSDSNLMFVSLQEAMEHIEDWVVDWDLDLTPEEIAVVCDPEWRAGLAIDPKEPEESNTMYSMEDIRLAADVELVAGKLTANGTLGADITIDLGRSLFPGYREMTHKIKFAFGEGHGWGFMYTKGLHALGLPEILCDPVPR